MKKNQYTVPQMSTYVLTSNEALLITMSQNGETVIQDGGKASENNIISADVKAHRFSVWDDDWSK